MPPYSEKRLKNYALWYYERYLPSVNKLREKLMNKCESDEKLVEKVVTEIKDVFIEDALLDAKVRFLIESHKNIRFIRQTLQKKGFDPKQINEKLEEYNEELNNWEYHRNAIEKKYKELSQKGKSQKIIIQTLCLKFPNFKAEITSLLTSPDEEDEKLKSEYEKLCAKNPIKTYEDRQKIAAKLMQRGFEYSNIKGIISKNANNPKR